MDAYEAIIKRVSPIELTDPAPDEATERKILTAGLRAPDHGRLRPWRFITIRGEGRGKFGDVLAESLRRRDPAAAPEVLGRERKKAFRAPLIVVVAAKIVPHSKIPAVEQLLSAGAAAYSLQLACQAFGFAAVWKTGDAAYDSYTKNALGLEASDAIAGFLYIGTSKAAPPEPDALDLSAFARDWPAS
jgi:nitroreductase